MSKKKRKKGKKKQLVLIELFDRVKTLRLLKLSRLGEIIFLDYPPFNPPTNTNRPGYVLSS